MISLYIVTISIFKVRKYLTLKQHIMKKKVTIWLATIFGIGIIVIAVLYSTNTLPTDQISGTIKKSERYSKTQTKIGDIILAPDVLNNEETGQKLAINILQLSYITENIADQTEEIISRISASSISDTEKTNISNPLTGYHEMIVNNTQLMRKSSEDILAYLDSDIKETSGDLDKTFMDLGGFFNRYKNDNSIFTSAISALEKLVADNSDLLQKETPSDLEIIRDKLYTVAYLNANFLQEKEIKKEILEKIIAQTENVDENSNTLIYNNQTNKFQVIRNQEGMLGVYGPHYFLFSNDLNGLIEVPSQIILSAEEGSNFNAVFMNNDISAIYSMAESMDAVTLKSMAYSSMEKYSGHYIMNANDLKSVLSQQDLQAVAMSPVMSLTKASAEELNSILSQEDLGTMVSLSQEKLSNSDALKIALGIFSTNAVNDLNLQIDVSTLDMYRSHDLAAIDALQSCLSQEKLQFIPFGAMEAVTLKGTFDSNLGIHSQVGLDFLPSEVVNSFSEVNAMNGINQLNSGIMLDMSSLSVNLQ